MTATARLVGDIGGTNTRLARFDPGSGQLDHIRSYTNREHASLEAIISGWLEESGGTSPEHCCLAVAAPPFDDQVTMLNIDWTFSKRELARRFNFAQINCVNDFEANAYALPHLQPEDLTTLRGGAQIARAKCATVGPGTGLGGATLEFCVDTPVATASEPGHMGLSPANELELELFRVLLAEFGKVWAELILSGPGLVRLYAALAQIRGESGELPTAVEISEAALQGRSALCVQALNTFCELLGSVCGDYVLATGSYGGLYIAGGIVPQIQAFIRSSDIARRFDDKGEMSQHLAAVPLHIVTAPTLGLTGAAHAPLQHWR